MTPDVPDAGPALDLILAGGGLANGLIALRLLEQRPDIRLAVVEQQPCLGGAHTWSFFESDLSPAQRAWIGPLVAHRWNGYQVRFPGRRRVLSTGYASITATRFDAVVRARLGDRLVAGSAVRGLSRTGVDLADGRRLAARAVVDGRGPEPAPELVLGFQKFVGLELRLAQPHGLSQPIIMDATVAQLDGYRFFYVLPLSADSVLVEDTRYSDGAMLDRGRLRQDVLDYVAAQGWQVAEVVREEDGVLPIALEGDIDAFWAARGGVPRVGLRAALFHPTTGYSVPDAVRLADLVCALPVLTPEALSAAVEGVSRANWGDRGFFRLLNRMLFRAGVPGLRYKVMERFYGLPEPLIERFYACRLTLADKLRLITGKPPVPFFPALTCIFENKAPSMKVQA
ncbi:lycopene beta-cyclase CrtY [Zavarzinia sp. CC-PAN008]|uniref:lycopene beta-cyclase CrtY n=1 Tax=Zavarzinia sp. CC-PAN008 TaxID=3243332 RepID=UPI003F743C9B